MVAPRHPSGPRRPRSSGRWCAAATAAAATLLLVLLGRGEAATGATDKDILLDLVARCTSDGAGAWPAALNWTAAAELCDDWRGVACDPTGRHVTRLSVPAPAAPTDSIACDAALLAGVAWSDLTFLSLMSFPGHAFAGALPAQALEPPSLQYAAFRDNNLTALPAALRPNHTLARMTSLDLAGNQLGGPVPGSLLGGLNLQHLSLARNALSGTIPAALFGPALVSADLRANAFTGAIPASLWQPGLRVADLGANALAGTLAAAAGAVGAGAAFVDLRLDGNFLSGTVPPALASLSNLDVLDLSGNLFTGHLPAIGNAAGAAVLALGPGNDFDCPLPPPAALYRDNASAECACRAGLYGDDAACRFCPVGTANAADGSAADGWVAHCTACAPGFGTEGIGATVCVAEATTAAAAATTTTTHVADGAVEHYDWGIFVGSVWLLLILVASAAAFGQEFGGGHHPEWLKTAASSSSLSSSRAATGGADGGRGKAGATVSPIHSVDLTFGRLESVPQRQRQRRRQEEEGGREAEDEGGEAPVAEAGGTREQQRAREEERLRQSVVVSRGDTMQLVSP